MTLNSVEEDHIKQDYILPDITVNQRRHLIFATQQQLDLLACAKTWYMDATIKVLRPPFIACHCELLTQDFVMFYKYYLSLCIHISLL